MKNKLFWLCILCFSIISCDEIANSGNSGNGKQGVSGQTPPATTRNISPQELEKLGQVVSTSSINTKMADAGNATWVSSPFQIALQFAGDQIESRKKVVTAESFSGGENFDKLIVTVEEEGLLDDSVKGTMLILRMEKKGSAWEVTKASRVWRCWPGRGHVSFSSEACR